MHDGLGLAVVLTSDCISCVFLFIAYIILGLLLDSLHGAAILVSEVDAIIERVKDQGVAIETISEFSHAGFETVNTISDALLHRLLRNRIDFGVHLDCEQVL